MIAITTKYLGPTDTRGARIKATAPSKNTATISYPYDLNSERAHRKAAETLHALGSVHAFVVTGDRIDELPLDDSGVIFEVTPAGVERRMVTASEHGLPIASTESLAGGDPEANAALVESILAGEVSGAKRDVVVLNAGASLVVAGLAADIREGVAKANGTIDSGAATDLLRRLQARSAAAA